MDGQPFFMVAELHHIGQREARSLESALAQLVAAAIVSLERIVGKVGFRKVWQRQAVGVIIAVQH